MITLNDLPLANSANVALTRLKYLAGIQDDPLSGAELLYERAYILSRAIPKNESCQFVQCKGALLAVNLPRESDWELIPAWLGPWVQDLRIDPNDWGKLRSQCLHIPARELLDQARQLSLAVSIADVLPSPPAEPWVSHSFPHTMEQSSITAKQTPLVVDLSSLWAGPLCSHLLNKAGCRVIKVESHSRLDGARNGDSTFYNLINQSKESVTLDFQSDRDLHCLRQLLHHADIVIEGSRPRALRNLGIFAEDFLARKRAKIWLSITAYGRDKENASRVGFGDDTAVAAGLSKVMFLATGEYSLVGDAIADPLTGIHSALAAWESYQAGKNELISIALKDVVAYCLNQELGHDQKQLFHACNTWKSYKTQLSVLFPSGTRTPSGMAASAGDHNKRVFEELELLPWPIDQQHHP